MRTHILLNLLNELGKIDKLRGLSNILSLFRSEFIKFKSTNVRSYRILSYHIKITLKSYFCCKTLLFCHHVRNVVMDVITFSRKSVNHHFFCMTLFHSQPRRHMINMQGLMAVRQIQFLIVDFAVLAFPPI